MNPEATRTTWAAAISPVVVALFLEEGFITDDLSSVFVSMRRELPDPHPIGEYPVVFVSASSTLLGPRVALLPGATLAALRPTPPPPLLNLVHTSPLPEQGFGSPRTS